MPLYIYQHPDTKEIREVLQSIHEEHIFVDENEIKWDRIFTVPNASIDSRLNPWQPNDFINKTSRNGDNIGALWDRSRELSEKRASENGGIDPVKEKYFKDYAKERNGKEHPLKKQNKNTFQV
ncbi:MAG: hypothetical protein HC836_12510 [Richelia sp. RM2_1_2]|nr:hypothetical protein [Richelia sp. RM2_1_2]